MINPSTDKLWERVTVPLVKNFQQLSDSQIYQCDCLIVSNGKSDLLIDFPLVTNKLLDTGVVPSVKNFQISSDIPKIVRNSDFLIDFLLRFDQNLKKTNDRPLGRIINMQQKLIS